MSVPTMPKWSNTMPEIIEDLFDKFDKGELRTSSREVDLSGTDASSGEVSITMDTLVSVEDGLSVLVDTSNGDTPEYHAVDDSATNTDVVGGHVYADESELDNTTLEDNQVGVQFFLGDRSVGSTETPDKIKVIARGY